MSQQSPKLPNAPAANGPCVPDRFTEFLISLGYKPELAQRITPAQFCRAKDSAWFGQLRDVHREKTAALQKPSPETRLPTRLSAGLPGIAPPGVLLEELDREFASDEERFPFFTASQLNSGLFETRYLIPGILVAGQPGGIFGAFKTLKTSLAADLLISLASGTPFLGEFPVAQAGRRSSFRANRAWRPCSRSRGGSARLAAWPWMSSRISSFHPGFPGSTITPTCGP
jgi:hypothetical protein